MTPAERTMGSTLPSRGEVPSPAPVASPSRRDRALIASCIVLITALATNNQGADRVVRPCPDDLRPNWRRCSPHTPRNTSARLISHGATGPGRCQRSRPVTGTSRASGVETNTVRASRSTSHTSRTPRAR